MLLSADCRFITPSLTRTVHVKFIIVTYALFPASTARFMMPLNLARLSSRPRPRTMPADPKGIHRIRPRELSSLPPPSCCGGARDITSGWPEVASLFAISNYLTTARSQAARHASLFPRSPLALFRSLSLCSSVSPDLPFSSSEMANAEVEDDRSRATG